MTQRVKNVVSGKKENIIMSNPWVNAYNHPNFVGYTKDQIDEMLMCELEEIYSYE